MTEKQYVGLDVSQQQTFVCVINEGGRREWQGKCATTPEAIVAIVRQRASRAVGVALETGPLSTWLWHGLRNAGIPAVCLHARQAAAALSLQINKTDTNDAAGLAQIVRTGWCRPVAVKSLASHRLQTLLAARRKLVTMHTATYNQIRGLLKTFGVVLGPGKGGTFEAQVRAKLPDDPPVREAIAALLSVWKTVSAEKLRLERTLQRLARASDVCQRLATVPGVGTITSLCFVAAIDDPHRFRRTSDVGAYLGLTPTRYQSGEVDRSGRISKNGDRLARSYLFEAANALLTRSRIRCALRTWGLRLAKRSGARKARVAVARKLALILLRIWLDETVFSAQGRIAHVAA
jgi:transposase